MVSMEEHSRYAEIEEHAEALGLCIMGAVAAADRGSQGGHNHGAISDTPLSESPPSDNPHGSLILLGTAHSFWPQFQTSPEWADGAPNPIDRWSTRVLTTLAAQLGARARFPFGGPPYEPFIKWAQQSARFFTSPSQMLVHDAHGMMISLRGALEFEDRFPIPAPARTAPPCDSCATQPCLSTCPVAALPKGGPYDVAACGSHLSQPAGAPCLSQGCLARRACPLSAGAHRAPAQNAHHMQAFLANLHPATPDSKDSSLTP